MEISEDSNLPPREPLEPIKEEEESHAEHQAAESKDENNSDDVDTEEAETCPLFMDSLPMGFDKNPALAAIASLLEDDENVTTESPSLKPSRAPVVPGGGKTRRKGRMHSKSARNPYTKPKKVTERLGGTSIGEAQLFLNMWKL